MQQDPIHRSIWGEYIWEDLTPYIFEDTTHLSKNYIKIGIKLNERRFKLQLHGPHDQVPPWLWYHQRSFRLPPLCLREKIKQESYGQYDTPPPCQPAKEPEFISSNDSSPWERRTIWTVTWSWNCSNPFKFRTKSLTVDKHQLIERCHRRWMHHATSSIIHLFQMSSKNFFMVLLA